MPLQRLTTRATPKPTKAAARYTPAGGAERCGMCRHFAAPSACSRILGPVSASGWCAYFSRQVTYADHAGQQTVLGGAAGASLDLSFMSAGSLPSGVSFARASTATYFDNTGTLRTAATNAPRWDYDPVTHVLRGLLIEEGRTNLVLNSADASNASWAKSSITVAAPVVTGAQITAPDGTLTGARVVLPAVSVAGNSSTLLVSSGGLGTIGQPAAFSVWLRGSVGGEQTYLSGTPDGAAYFRQAVTLTTSWQRFVLVTGNITAGTFFAIGTDRRDASQAATSAQTIFVWGGQVEVGGVQTSYIPTTAASVTRASDVCTIPTAAWFNANTTTLMAEIYCPVTPLGAIAGLGDGANFGNSFYLENGPPSGAIRAGGGTANSGSITVGAVNKIAATNTATQITCSVNGAAVGSAAQSASALTTTTLLAIGYASWTGGGGQVDAHMRRVRYWPRALSNAELQSVTT